DCASAQACGELVGDREQSRQLWTLIRIWRAEMASFWTLPGREATVPMFASISGVSDGIVAIASRRAGGRAHEPRTSSVLLCGAASVRRVESRVPPPPTQVGPGGFVMNLIRGLIVSVVLLALASAACSVRAKTSSAASGMAHTDSIAHSLNINLSDLKWNRMFPELGDKSSEISILHKDPNTHATQLLIRVPRDFHVPMHWHSANETHTVIEGTFVMECEGKRVALNAGGFNYMPAHMRHEAW